MATRVKLSLRHKSPTAYTLDFQGRTLLCFEDSGKRGRLVSLEPGPFMPADILRWGAPFALAPQGIVSLHASAVAKNGMMVAFLGIGGAGKSTIARRLRERQWEKLVDDMMMVDDTGRVNANCEEVVHDWCRAQAEKQDITYEDLANELQKPGYQRWVSLKGIVFLEKPRGEKFRLRPLASGECFHRLVKYGFGGLPTPAAWEHQFRVYGVLAGRLKAAVLQPPNGLELLVNQLPHLEVSLSQWLSDSEVAKN
ncbi:MAG TPA: hypothetical protein VGX70_20335 [Gemmataceae bacterium]|jgi:hypothetical protein|nr:hypothetical protein [Gemmataceae bacterium]